MKETLPTRTGSGIIYSQYKAPQVAAEQCVAMHGMSYLLAGSLRMTDADASRTFGAGSLLFHRKDFLAKFTKLPAEDGPFQAITVVFDQATLLEFSQQPGIVSEQSSVASTAALPLAASPLLYSFYATLLPYFKEPLTVPLAQLKQREALRLLLHTHPALQPVLFDFGQPGKIDLEAFMRQNFRFNLGLQQLAQHVLKLLTNETPVSLVARDVLRFLGALNLGYVVVAVAGAFQATSVAGVSLVLALANGSQLTLDLYAHRTGRWKQRLIAITLLDGFFTLSYGGYLTYLALSLW